MSAGFCINSYFPPRNCEGIDATALKSINACTLNQALCQPNVQFRAPTQYVRCVRLCTIRTPAVKGQSSKELQRAVQRSGACSAAITISLGEEDAHVDSLLTPNEDGPGGRNLGAKRLNEILLS